MLRLGLGIALYISLLDQATKWFILERIMVPPRPIEVAHLQSCSGAEPWGEFRASQFCIGVDADLAIGVCRCSFAVLSCLVKTN